MPTLDPFLDPLPIPKIQEPLAVGPDSTRYYRITMQNGKCKIFAQLPAPTPFWGYEGMFPSPSIETPVNRKVVVEFVNALTNPWPFFNPSAPASAPSHPFVPELPSAGAGREPSLSWERPVALPRTFSRRSPCFNNSRDG